MKICSKCGTQNDDNAQFCAKCSAPFENGVVNGGYVPNNQSPVSQPPKKKMPAWKIVLIVLACLIGLGIVSSFFSSDESDSSTTNQETSSVVAQQEQTESTTKKETTTEKKVPVEYKSALKKAQTYSDMMHMSKQGIYDQLTSEYGEDFSKEAARYAIDNLEADFKQNALEKARTYQESMAMSPNAIKEQLTSEYGEKFTKEEAEYAIEHLEK